MLLDTCAPPIFPFCGRAERERERERLARGVARVSSGHLFNWEPTWPPELTPASDRPICTITSSWKCVPCHVHVGFSSSDLDSPVAHPSRKSRGDHQPTMMDRVCLRFMRPSNFFSKEKTFWEGKYRKKKNRNSKVFRQNFERSLPEE